MHINFSTFRSNNKSLVDGALFSGFSFINKGFGFVLLMVLASYILPEEYGSLSLFSTFVMLVGFFIAFSTEGYLGVVFFRDGLSGVRKTISAITLLSIFVSCFICLFLFCGNDFFPVLLSLPFHVLISGVVVSFLSLFSNLYLDYLRLQEKVFLYGTFSCTSALSNFIVSILLVKYLMMGWEGRVYAQVVCGLFYGIYALLYFGFERYYERPSWIHIKKMLIWGIPLIPHLATAFIRQGCDRYIINYYYGLEEVGLFSFGLNIASILLMVGLGFNQSNSVDIFKVLSDTNMSNGQKDNKLKKSRVLFWKLYFLFSFILIIAGYILIPLILPAYSGAVNYLAILSLYSFFFCVYLIYTNYLYYYGLTKQIMYATVSTSLLHLLLSLLLTPYSLYLTSLIYVITQMLASLYIMIKAKQIMKTNLI